MPRTGLRLASTFEAVRKMLVAMNCLDSLESYFYESELKELKRQRLI
jgi:hypothetical protein